MHIFAISGLGADKRVFQFLELDYEWVALDWIAPQKGETLSQYAHRFIAHYELEQEQNAVLLGVSFGGMVAVEISKRINPRLTMLISSAETRQELPVWMRFLGKTFLDTTLPASLFNPPRKLAYYFFGTRRRALLNAILEDTDPTFAKWAVGALMRWENEQVLSARVKICGTHDRLLPPKDPHAIFIEKGGHFMIVDQAPQISSILNSHLNALS